MSSELRVLAGGSPGSVHFRCAYSKDHCAFRHDGSAENVVSRRAEIETTPELSDRTDDEDLGRAIAYLRAERTQAEVAKRAGLDPATWSLYEAGRRRPRPPTTLRILRGLGATRLELEEVASQFRRARFADLPRTEARGRPGKARGEVAAVARAFPPPGRELADPLRNEIRALLGRLVPLLEDLCVLVGRGRS